MGATIEICCVGCGAWWIVKMFWRWLSLLLHKVFVLPTRWSFGVAVQGGFTVLNALVHSKSFAAGASYYGVADCTTLATDTHDFESRYLDTMIGAYPAEKDLYIARSPITHVNQLSSPLILFQGLDDTVVPPSQSEAFRDACAAKGLKHAYVAYEGEGHGFRQASTIVSSLETELKFYGEVLGFVPQM